MPTEQQLIELAKNPAVALAELERRKQPFYRYFRPEDHAGYAKHVKFMQSQKKKKAFIGGNRCLTPWSVVATDCGERRVSEIIGAGAFAVRSWDGNSLCTKPASPVFLKGIEPAFHVLLDSGEAFQCSGMHRVWRPADSALRRPSGWVSISQIARGEGVRHWTRNTPDSLASCDADGRHDDGPPRRVAGFVLSRPHGLLDVPSSDPSRLPSDEVASKSERSHVYRGLSPLSTVDVEPLDVALFGDVFSARVGGFCVPPKGWLHQPSLQSGAECSLGQEDLEFEILQALRPEVKAVSFPWCAPPLFGGNKILALVEIGFQEIWDLSVADTNCYFSAGVLHHNSGKTTTVCYELAAHLTGQYPKWWEGTRFSGPISSWACANTNDRAKEILQAKLLGAKDPPEAGMIPLDCRGTPVNRMGMSGAVKSISVKHVSGGYSALTFKSYDERRQGFEGTAQQLILLDEECPQDIFDECVIRTMTVGGVVMVSFTPLMGLTNVVEGFMPSGLAEQCPDDRFVVNVEWDEAPHLTEQMKAEMRATFPAHQLLAREKGIPQLGSGAIFQVPESEIVCEPFQIPDHWRYCSGTDNSGWNYRASVWGALDPATDVLYIYDTWKRERVEPAVHIAAISGRGKWIPGVYDPAANFRDVGIDTFVAADNDVEAGIYDVDKRLTEGRLKVFRSCSKEILDEYRVYRRDDKGRIVKQNDDLMDSLRYLVRSGIAIARPKPHNKPKPTGRTFDAVSGSKDGGWMG